MEHKKRVYTFGAGKAEGRADMRNELGGKGANLAEMNLIGVPVPPGFTITTDTCNDYYEIGKQEVVELLRADVEKALHGVEELMASKFGDVENPLLLSVRSGARASMPGMMDTILNLGLNDEVVEGFQLLGRRKLARHKQVRRFLEAETVFGDSVVDQIGNAVAAIRQAAAIGNFIALGNNVAMHVRDIRNANHNARTVGIAQASFDIVSGVITRID